MESIKQLEEFKPMPISDLKEKIEQRNRDYTLHQLSVMEYIKEHPNSTKQSIALGVELREDFESDTDKTIYSLLEIGLIQVGVVKSRKVYNLA